MPFWRARTALGCLVTYHTEWLLQAYFGRGPIDSTSFGLVSRIEGWGPA